MLQQKQFPSVSLVVNLQRDVFPWQSEMKPHMVSLLFPLTGFHFNQGPGFAEVQSCPSEGRNYMIVHQSALK